jgi:hypothetical protein
MILWMGMTSGHGSTALDLASRSQQSQVELLGEGSCMSLTASLA